MATKRRGRKASSKFTPGQAQYILEQLIRDNRISREDLAKYSAKLAEEANQLVERLKQLGWQIGAAAAGAVDVAATSVGKTARRVKRISADRRATMQLQGRYLGLIRQIPAARREQYSRIAKENGREEAIKAILAELGGGARKKGRKRSGQ